MLDFIAYPIGVVLKGIYDTLAFQNYGLAIVILTLTIRSLMIPLYIKQIHSTAKMSELQPEIQNIQKKYAKDKDKDKQTQEMMNLYKEKGFNPMGGCLPLVIQMPIMFSLYYVISQPLKYMLGKSTETISKLFARIPTGADRISNMKDLSIISYFSTHMDRLKDAGVGSMLKASDLLNMNFLGVNLGTVPTLDIHKYIGSSIQTNHIVLLAVPLLAVLTTYLSTKMATAQAIQPQGNEAMASQQKWMMIISPLMTGYFAFSVPAGLGLYWIVGNIFLIFQQLIINKFVLRKKTEEIAEKETVEDTDIDAEKDNVKAQETDESPSSEPS